MVEKFFNENASVGQTPIHPPHSIHSEGVKAGILSTIFMVETGQMSIHLVHFELLLLALTQEAISNFKFITLNNNFY